MFRVRLITSLLVVLFLAAGCNMAEQSSVSQPAAQISTAPPGATCEELVALAETSVGLVCNNLGRNQACYGNRVVAVDFLPNSELTFNQSGDTVSLLDVRRISTAPLDMTTHDWGIAVLKAQANLPDSLPGQNVTFLLFGDTVLDNPSPDMRAVTVSTRIGNIECEDAPDSGVLIQSPEGTQVTMNLNGAEVTLGSTAYVTTNEETQRMTFAVIEGQGVITAFDETRIVPAGAKTGLPLGSGDDGLQVSGPPSDPSPYDITTLHNIPVNLLDRKITVHDPIDPADIPQVTPTLASTETPVGSACVPRSDWTARYVIQRGDNLSIIALRLNIRTADLQEANCIENPNNLIAGQTILVPRAVPTNTPAATATPIPSPTLAGPIGPNLRADMNPIGYHACTTIRWDVDNIREVYFEGQPVVGHDSRQVCPEQTTTYTLLVVLLDGTRQPYQITITVQAVCGNDICEPSEYDTCSADCDSLS